MDGDIARRIERDQIDDFAASFITRGVGAEDKLRRCLLHALERFEALEHAIVKRQVRRFRGQQCGGDIGQGTGRNHEHIRAQTRKANRHAGFDALHQDGAGEHGAAADRHCRQQQQRARLAPPKVLQRQACQQESDAGFARHRALPIFAARASDQSVHERVCFMCSSSVGIMTQS